MKKLPLLIVALACVSSASFGQMNTKMDGYLADQMQQNTSKNAFTNPMLPMLVKGDINTIKQLVEKNHGTFKYAHGGIAAIVIPASALPDFNESKAITRMEGAPQKIYLCNDTMRVRNSIVQVQQGLSPLPRAYNGKGIVMGFIDTGIDYFHPDFIDANGHTRIKYYWDQNQATGTYTPQPYGYGQAWDSTEINNNLADNTASSGYGGHGSHVAGIAAANGRANKTCIGGAPDCDIIFVALDFSGSATVITDAADYIYTMADNLHEPCVINASLGSYNGSHDGNDLQAQMIDSMIADKQPGRAFVGAAGNAGNIAFHLHDSLTGTADTSMTWFMYDGANGEADIYLYSNVADFTNIQFAIAVDKVSTGSMSEQGITRFSTISSYLSSSTTSYLYNASFQEIGSIKYIAQEYSPGDYSMEFEITPDSTTYLWRLITTGTGRFDSWNYAIAGGASDIVDTTGLMLSQTKYPIMKHYKEPDNNETTNSSFQCSPFVITVGDYYNRQCWLDYNDAINCDGGSTPGLFEPTSSRGPSRNYALYKPDISGAGQNTMSVLPTTLRSGYIGSASADTGAWHVIGGGTSAASPGVAAVVALYMERYPTAKYTDIQYAITHCDSVDAFTGSAPNYLYGYGKVDAFKALSGGCPPASPTGIEDITPENPYTLNAYPNPATANVTVEYDFSGMKNYNKAQIVFYNIYGKQVKAVDIKDNQGSINMGANTLAAGIYFYTLMVDGNRLKTEKMEFLQ